MWILVNDLLNNRLAAALFVLLFASAPAHSAEIGEFLFNGDAADTSGAGASATVYGATLTQDRFGNPGRAFYFDGDDFIETSVPSNSVPLSFSVWFRADATPGEHSIVDSDISGAYGHSLIIGYALGGGVGSGTLDVQFHDGAVNSGVYIVPGVWSHAVVTYGDQIRLYLNGDLAFDSGYFAYAEGYFDGSDFRFGAHNPGDRQYFIGAIDDIRFYDQELDSTAVEALFAESAEAACSDGIDNDLDGQTDLEDPGCAGLADADEQEASLACDDGLDNDGDGKVDMQDPHCEGPYDDSPPGVSPGGVSRAEHPTRCEDGIDNDMDGEIDFDGGEFAGVPFVAPDTYCTRRGVDSEKKNKTFVDCGIGAELAPLLLMLRMLRRRQPTARTQPRARTSNSWR